MIRFTRGVMAKNPQDGVLVRGVLDPDTLKWLLVGEYQREVLGEDKIASLKKALLTGKVPDIELGMRGDKCQQDGDVFVLAQPTYIIDGLQRWTAAMLLIDEGRGHEFQLGATVRFDTTPEIERQLFIALNLKRSRIGPNVLLRDLAPDYSVIRLLLELCADKSFALNGKVSWQQVLRTQEVIGATSMAKVIGRLLTHLGRTRSANIVDLTEGLQKVMGKIGEDLFRQNVMAYFGYIETMWGIQNLADPKAAVHLKGNALMAFANVLSEHTDFWTPEGRLVIPGKIEDKLALFPWSANDVVLLVGGGHATRDRLCDLFERHINHGRTTNRLHKRPEKHGQRPPRKVEA